MADAEVLGRLIRSARLDKGLSREQLASAVGRSASTVRRWERAESAPSVDVVGDLATALDLDENELVAFAASARPDDGLAETEAVSDGDTAEEPQVPTTPAVRTTIEDEDVVVEVTDYFDTAAPVMPPPTQRQPSRFGRASSSVWGRRDSWIGWVRGFLTALALLFLFMGFVWALGELWTALQDVLGGFSTGA
jgi:transcriptional regulator with XRE-family HTH domain